MSRYRDPQRQVGEKYLHMYNFKQNTISGVGVENYSETDSEIEENIAY